MRFLLIAILLPALAHAAETIHPQWDGSESIEQYAKRANLPPTKTLDLGSGVKLELVLIPAGRFIMGTPEPEPVDEEGTGQVIFGFGGGALLVLLGMVLVQAFRTRQRPQYALAWFLAMTVAAGIGLLGGWQWYYSARALADAQTEYEADLARFKSSGEDATLAHWVTLSMPYYIGKYEVTQEQYQQIMGSNRSWVKGGALPVDVVSWNDAQEFCKRVSEKTGSVVRLPTDAEWERACRAGTKTTYYTGDAETDLDRAGWYMKNSKGASHPVGQKTANAWGVYDMHGNVVEWCEDWFETQKTDAVVDPQGPTKGKDRVLRGGCWDAPPKYSHSACRDKCSPQALASSHLSHGFRVVVEVPRTP